MKNGIHSIVRARRICCSYVAIQISSDRLGMILRLFLPKSVCIRETSICLAYAHIHGNNLVRAWLVLSTCFANQLLHSLYQRRACGAS
jgi:hypothetical protein